MFGILSKGERRYLVAQISKKRLRGRGQDSNYGKRIEEKRKSFDQYLIDVCLLWWTDKDLPRRSKIYRIMDMVLTEKPPESADKDYTLLHKKKVNLIENNAKEIMTEFVKKLSTLGVQPKTKNEEHSLYMALVENTDFRNTAPILKKIGKINSMSLEKAQRILSDTLFINKNSKRSKIFKTLSKSGMPGASGRGANYFCRQFEKKGIVEKYSEEWRLTPYGREIAKKLGAY